MIALFSALVSSALLLAFQAAPAQTAPPVLDALGRQALPRQGCAAYLWSVADRRLVAMATADPAGLKLSIAGSAADHPRESQSGVGGFGFAETTVYRRGEVAATLEMTIATRADLADGATVPNATLTIARTGADTLVLPVAGLIGCAPTR